MKVLVSLALAAACLAASPALAGPAGTGLSFTEEVAKKRAAAKVQALADCATPKAGEPAKPDAKSKTPGACRAS